MKKHSGVGTRSAVFFSICTLIIVSQKDGNRLRFSTMSPPSSPAFPSEQVAVSLNFLRRGTPKARPHCSCSCCRDSGWLLPVCTDSYSTDTVANPLSTWLIAPLGLGLVKPSTFTEGDETEHEHEQSGRSFTLVPHRTHSPYLDWPRSVPK
jgi:hypothetical protein